jgi:hypothetical protein
VYATAAEPWYVPVAHALAFGCHAADDRRLIVAFFDDGIVAVCVYTS